MEWDSTGGNVLLSESRGDGSDLPISHMTWWYGTQQPSPLPEMPREVRANRVSAQNQGAHCLPLPSRGQGTAREASVVPGQEGRQDPAE